MKRHLFNRGFLSLTATQFFGAANDNVLKSVLALAVALQGVWSNALGDGGQAYVSLCLTLPFIFLSGIAGQIADRFSKQRVALWVKIAEIFIALVGYAAFVMGSLWIAMATLLLLAVQSAFFGPAKYGMIPELVRAKELSRANGIINMMTNLAVIVGTLVAGPIYQAYYPRSDPALPVASLGPARLWLPGAAMLLVAALGLAACLFLPKLKAQDPKLKFSGNVFGPYIKAIPEMARSPLLLVASAWAFFYMIGMMALLILPDYKALLNVDPTQASYLLGVLGVSIGIGSVTAGLVSGSHIEPRLVPIGACGMTIGFVLLGLLPLNYYLVAALLFGSGFFAGFYIIPLQSLLQFLSPEDERGRFLGTANAMSFVASTLGSVIFLACRKLLHLDANRVFLVCAALSVVGIGLLIWRLRRVIADPRLRKPEMWEAPICVNCGFDLRSSIAGGAESCPQCSVAIPEEARGQF